MTLQLIKQATNDSVSSNILKGLNPEQQQAVETVDGPLLVIAGAGSGKTKVLTHRIAYLLQSGIAPNNILALTFTNKAASEMKERIAAIVSPYAASKIWAGTFHSIFARILRREADKIGYTSSFSIYDTDDSLSVIKAVMNQMGINQQQFPAQGVRSKISWAKNQMMDWQNYSQSASAINEKITAQVYKDYENHLIRNNAMDFDDLMSNMIKLFDKSPETLAKYQNIFKYILIDEYQDTNRAQYLVIHQLSKTHHNLCVVGDDAQSIYRWRGADIRNILDFQKEFSESKIIRLEQNYRSTKMILGAADCVIKNNRGQIPKTLWTDNPEGEKVDLLECYDDRNEADKIARIVKDKIKNVNLEPKDFAVLYRTNAQSLAIENSLRIAQIPYIIVGGISFFKRKEVKDTIAYLKLLLNPKDGESLVRIINEPPRGLGDVSLKHFRAYAELRNISLFEAFEEADKIDALQARAKNAAKMFCEFIKGFIKQKDELKPAELAMKYIEETGMLQMYKEIDTEESLDRWNNIQQLLSDIALFFRNNNQNKPEDVSESEESLATSLEDYLQQVALASEIDNSDTSGNQIKMMTIHSAKGLEFPVVFIAGLEHGLFPLSKAEFHLDEEEEERRLFYVAITRAREKLYLSYALRRMKFGTISDQAMSRFVTEIDDKYIQESKPKNQVPNRQVVSGSYNRENRLIDDFERKAKSSYSQINPYYEKKDSYSQIQKNSTYKPEISFKPGDKVRHPQFGEGRVEGIAGTGQNKQVLVFFRTVGKKRLMLQYARLERV